MKDSDKAEFAQIVRATFNNYGREAPNQETLRMWWGILLSQDMASVRMAFSRHVVTEPKFPPTIGQIVEILNAGSNASIGADEAWSIAVKACDETETVMMNDLIAQAWGAAQPIFDLGDEVGARMAFKGAYTRLQASSDGKPLRWWPSIGSDPHKRDSALSQAKQSGLLPAPQVAALLPPPVPKYSAGQEPEGLRRLKEEMKALNLKRVADDEQMSNRARLDRQAALDRKQEIARQVSRYQRGGSDD